MQTLRTSVAEPHHVNAPPGTPCTNFNAAPAGSARRLWPCNAGLTRRTNGKINEARLNVLQHSGIFIVNVTNKSCINKLHCLNVEL
jgi:hypothetical protein